MEGMGWRKRLKAAPSQNTIKAVGWEPPAVPTKGHRTPPGCLKKKNYYPGARRAFVT